jgi:hypothetical protein
MTSVALVPPKPKEFDRTPSISTPSRSVVTISPSRQCGVGGDDIGRGGDEAAVHHDQRIDRFVHPGAPSNARSATWSRRWAACCLAKDAADRFDLGDVADQVEVPWLLI